MSFRTVPTDGLLIQQRECVEKARQYKRKKSVEIARLRDKNNEEFAEITRELKRRSFAELTRTSPLIKTLTEDRQPRYSLADGTTVDQSLAADCIASGHVKPLDSGLIDNPQSWAAP